jgi:hypothetical protein
MGLSIAGLGLIAKHISFIDFGFYGNETSTEPDKNKKYSSIKIFIEKK